MKYYCCHWVSDTLHKRKGQIHVSGFSLLGMIIVMACVLVLLASLFLAREVAKARTHCYPLKSKGKGIWNAIRVANNDRELLGKYPLWPKDLKENGKVDGSSLKYWQFLFSNGDGIAQDNPDDQIVEDLWTGVLAAEGVPAAAWPSELKAANVVWRVAEVNDDSPGELPFIVTKNYNGPDTFTENDAAGNDAPIALNPREKPFGKRGVVWLTIGGASMDARKDAFTVSTFLGNVELQGQLNIWGM